MTAQLGIRIELSLVSAGGRIPAGAVIKAIKAISDAAYFSELRDLRAIGRAFDDLSADHVALALARARQYRQSSMSVESARTGSIILTGVVAGLSVWLLKETVGETVREAWKDSDMHARLKTFLTKRRQAKNIALTTDCWRRLTKAVSPEVVAEFEQATRDHEEGSTVKLRVYLLVAKNEPPPRNEAV